jgi:D-glycero-D-manno-heptose 1,7-bisphosphate phosphatase
MCERIGAVRDGFEPLLGADAVKGRRALFVDRDGTINVDKGHVYRPEHFEYIPRALEALRLASDRGMLIFIVTNQAGIAKGMYTEEEFLALTRHMLEQMKSDGIRIQDVLYCPHHPEGTVQMYRTTCACRKPAPGLLKAAIARYGLLAGNSAMIGDKNSDVEAGSVLGLRTYLVETGYGVEHKATTHADFVVSDLWDATVHFLSSRPMFVHPEETSPNARPKGCA